MQKLWILGSFTKQIGYQGSATIEQSIGARLKQEVYLHQELHHFVSSIPARFIKYIGCNSHHYSSWVEYDIEAKRRSSHPASFIYLQANALHTIILSTFTVPSGVFRMPSTGVNRASVEKALDHVDEADPTSLFAFFKQLKYLVTDDRKKGRVIPCSTLGPREVFEMFSLTNEYTDFGSYR